MKTEARVVIEDFRIDYNTRRPHSRLRYRSPVNYAANLLLSLRRDSFNDNRSITP